MVLVLLLSLMGLTVGLSTASRSLSDLKQITYVDAGTKAFAAAEAALQYGLSNIGSYSASTCTTEQAVPLSITGIKALTYRICSSNRDYAATLVPKDGVFELSVEGIPASIRSFDLVWSNPGAALEGIIVRNDYSVERYAVRGGSGPVNNGFQTTPIAGASCVDRSERHLCADDTFNDGYCYRGIPHMSTGDQFIRVKALYAETKIAICANDGSNGWGNGLEQDQILDVIVTATTDNGTVRRLQAVRTPAALPGIFDYAVYSRGQIIKE